MKHLLPYWLRVEARRAYRWLMLLPERGAFAGDQTMDTERFHYEMVSHTSKLLRTVTQELMQLQQNKIRNLKLACEKLDRLVIEPGAVFSFCHCVGRTTKRRGYLNGLEMRNGALTGAPGGGLCQLANLIYWMAVLLDLDIIERHRHELDLFPDDERQVPFGMGATVFYNYRDLRFRNTLGQALLLRVSVDPPLLWGKLLSTKDKPFDVRIYETDHRYVRRADGSIWRENHVAKRVVYRDGRAPLVAEIAHNIGRVCYEVKPECLVESDVVSSTGV